MPGDQPTATERAYALFDSYASDDYWAATKIVDILVEWHPDLLADLAIEAGGLEQVSDLGIHAADERMAGVPFDVEVKAGEGYHARFPLRDDDEPVYRRTRKGERDG